MILAFHPTQAEVLIQEFPMPANWIQFLTPWSKAIYRQHEFGMTLTQEMINREFAISIWTLEVQKTARLYMVADHPTIVLQFMIRGNIVFNLSGFGQKNIKNGNYEMFYVPEGFNEALFEPGIYELLHIELRPFYLERLIAVKPEIQELIARYRNSGTEGMSMASAHVTYITRAILQNLRTCAKEGALLKLELHKYILELLSEYFNDIMQNEENESRINIHYKNLMIKIREHILSEPNVHEHTVTKLARQFGISESLLKRQFKINFEKTVSEFVRFHALSKATYLLTTSKISIENIAEEIGYSSREALERSFKKAFNYSPSNLRSGTNSKKRNN